MGTAGIAIARPKAFLDIGLATRQGEQRFRPKGLDTWKLPEHLAAKMPPGYDPQVVIGFDPGVPGAGVMFKRDEEDNWTVQPPIPPLHYRVDFKTREQLQEMYPPPRRSDRKHMVTDWAYRPETYSKTQGGKGATDLFQLRHADTGRSLVYTKAELMDAIGARVALAYKSAGSVGFPPPITKRIQEKVFQEWLQRGESARASLI